MSKGHIKNTRELRRFGLAFGTAMTLLGSFLLWRERPAGPYVLGFAVALFASAIVFPGILRPLEALLGRIARAVTAVLTYLVLTSAFYLVITPIGLLVRLGGKDSLGLKPAPERESFWEPVEPDGPVTRPDKPY